MPRTQEENKRHCKAEYQKYKSKYIERALRLKQRRREFVRQQKIGKSCKYCGESRPYCLDWHHPNQDKEQGLCQMAHRGCSEAKLLAEIAKCELVCRNCLAEIHYKECYNEQL